MDFHWGDYIYNMEGEGEITLSSLLEKLGVTEITAADVTGVSFTNPDYIEIEQLDSDWLLRSLAPFSSEEALVLTLKNGETVTIKVTDEGETVTAPTPIEGLVYDGEEKALITAGSTTDGTFYYAIGSNAEVAPEDNTEAITNWSTEIPKATNAGDYYVWYKLIDNDSIIVSEQSLTVTISPATHNLKVTMNAGEFDTSTNTISYTVVVEAEGDSFFGETDHPVTISTTSADLTFDSGSYTYAHKEGSDHNQESQVNETPVSANTETLFTASSLTVSHMYDGDVITLTYTAKVDNAVYNASENATQVVNTAAITWEQSENPNIVIIPHDMPGEKHY